MKELYNKTEKIKKINEELINKKLTKVINDLKEPLYKSEGSTEVKTKEINEELINKNLTEVIDDLKEPLVKSEGFNEAENIYNVEEIQKIVSEIFKETKNFYKTLKYPEIKKINNEKLILKKGLTEILRKSGMLKKCRGRLKGIKDKQTKKYGESSQNPSKLKIEIQYNGEGLYEKPSENQLESGILIQDNWEDLYYESSESLLKSSIMIKKEIEVKDLDQENPSNKIQLEENKNKYNQMKKVRLILF